MATPLHAADASDETAGEAFNLDAVANEAAGPFPFTLGGETFYLKHPEDIDRKAVRRLEVLMSASTSDIEAMEENLKTLLGAEQWKRFDDHDLSLRQLMALMNQWTEHFGISIPESPASTPSSKKKARR